MRISDWSADVCSSDLALAKWTGTAPRIVSLAPATLSQVWETFGVVGETLDIRWAGRELAERARERVEVIAERVRPATSRPTVACVEWFDPPMIAGNWIPEMVVAAGGQAVLAKRGEPAAPRSEEQPSELQSIMR